MADQVFKFISIFITLLSSFFNLQDFLLGSLGKCYHTFLAFRKQGYLKHVAISGNRIAEWFHIALPKNFSCHATMNVGRITGHREVGCSGSPGEHVPGLQALLMTTFLKTEFAVITEKMACLPHLMC